jgi:hypothetical protein
MLLCWTKLVIVSSNYSVLVEDNRDKIRNGEWKERLYAWNPLS